jgi:Ca2+-binding RTX toxin-like protein
MASQMQGFFLTLTSSATFGIDAPNIDILIDGVVFTSFSESEVTGLGSTTQTFYIPYTGVPASIGARINDGSAEVGRTVTLDNVLINGRDIRDATLMGGQGQQATFSFADNLDFNMTDTTWMFGQQAPTIGMFGTPTYVGTAAMDFHNGSKTELDVIDLGDGHDTANGNQDNDIIFGGLGNDKLVGAAGIDVLVGGAGNDTLRGQLGDDILYGEDGDDTIYGNEGNDVLNGGLGNDLMNGFDDDDIMYGEAGVDRLLGGTGNDRIYGGDDKDFLYGEEGNDHIYGGTGNDIIDGGDGDNIIDGGDGNDRIYGGAAVDTIVGGAGLDTIYAGAGDDTIDGGDDNDRIEGNDGNDIINGDAGQDNISGGAGDDTIDGGTSADTLHGDDGNDIVNGGDHNDTLYGDLGNDTLNGDAGSDRVYGGDGDDDVSGGTGNDFLYGDAGADTLNGGSGSDRLYGGVGADTLNGGDHDDTIDGGDGNDILNGDGGHDILRGDAGADTLNGGNGNDNLFGGDGDDNLNGGDGVDRLKGGIGNDTLHGGNDDDVLAGEDGDDIIYGDAGNDKLYGQAGNDTLHGGDGDDKISGREGNDILNGNAGNDSLTYDGIDVIDGGADTDTLTVSGYDTVTIDFSSGLATNVEVIDMANQNGIAAVNNLQISMADIAAHTDSGSITITGDLGLDQVNFSLTGFEVRGADVTINSVDYAEFTLGGSTAFIQIGLVYNGSVLAPSGGGGGGGGNTPTTGDDFLTGTAAADTISGLAGNDTIIGDDGHDILNGDEGNDSVYGGRGNDTINGGDGNDILYASLTGSIEQGVNPATVEANNSGVFYNSDTGNFYQFVSASVTQGAASAAAAATTINGIAGHLATITSSAENTFIGNLTGTSFAWIDGTDSATEGTFVWTEGPDSGTQFWTDVGNYQNFYQSTPTTNSGARDNVLFLGDTYSDTWYAWESAYNTNYVIEWEGGAITQETIIGYDSRNETNYLNGGDGDDTLHGSMGNDVLIGGNGADVIEGGAGNDKLYASGFSDAEIQTILTANPGVSYSEETGNFYRFITTGSNYGEALAAATGSTINGVTGHLATITSQDENAFITNLVGANFAWIDGSDADTEGTFSWTAGADAGVQFWNDIGNYENWYQNSPTSNSGANDHVTFLGTNYNGQWYVFADNTTQGYVVEWDASDFDTETSANSLSGGLGADDLYASTGLDTFIFKADSAFVDVDTIYGFDNAEDIIDASDVLAGLTVDATNINDYISIDQTTGVRIDVTGSGTFGTATQIAIFQGATGVDDALTMFNEGELIV